MLAVRWAAAEAARREAPLRLVLAFAWPHNALRRSGGQEQMHRDVLLTAARGQLGVAAAAAVRDEPGLDVQEQLVVGSPIPVLAEEAGRAQLLVLGDRGRGQVEGLLVGSVAGALAPHGPCPVVVVRGDEQASTALPVIVGVDEHSDAAIAFAFEAAAARRVSVVAVHSWWQPVFEPRDGGEAGRTADQSDEGFAWVGRWAQKFPGFFLELAIAGSPAIGLLSRAARPARRRRSRVVAASLRWSSDRSGLLLTARCAQSP